MNKYQKAFEKVKEACASFDTVDELITLKELVDKATPKKPIVKYDNFGDGTLCCPNCNQSIVNVWSKRKYRPKYCHYCGQALDWSEEDE